MTNCLWQYVRICWWLVRVTLVVDSLFLLQNFQRWGERQGARQGVRQGARQGARRATWWNFHYLIFVVSCFFSIGVLHILTLPPNSHAMIDPHTSNKVTLVAPSRSRKYTSKHPHETLVSHRSRKWVSSGGSRISQSGGVNRFFCPIVSETPFRHPSMVRVTKSSNWFYELFLLGSHGIHPRKDIIPLCINPI